MKRNLLFTIVSALSAVLMVSCELLLEPDDDGHSTKERTEYDPVFGEGLLSYAYSMLPYHNDYPFTDVATDDAVSNVRGHGFMKVATGQWSAQNNPDYISNWTRSIRGIISVNEFFPVIDKIEWKWSSELTNRAYIRRFTGEAYALRGILKYYLLESVGGTGADGQMLGFPDYDKVEGDQLNIPRMSLEESLRNIYADMEKALDYLPMDYKDAAGAAAIPAGFEEFRESPDIYNVVFGSNLIQKISGRIVKAFRAKLALLEASPRFNPSGDAALWAKAAEYAGELLAEHPGLDPQGHLYYTPAIVNAMTKLNDTKEMVWRRPKVNIRSRETKAFPPSMFGNGDVNPTQNLVDVFPMKNGYPIGEADSQYDAGNPYQGRDPRLAQYIVYNGNKIGSTTITTAVGGGQNAKDSLFTSTRTGYYLKKTLRDDVSLNPLNATSRDQVYVYLRFTELYLLYAEAANEAWGPDGTGAAYGSSARDVIGAIRQRAGIDQPDEYLASVTDKGAMQRLIRDERRIELCFEGHRFWDLRRWKADLTQPAKGINIGYGGSSYTVVEVEDRIYNNDYMYNGPIPYADVLNYDALKQNKGW